MTRQEALDFLITREWDCTSVMGHIWIVGPIKDGVIEARGQGNSLESAVAKAIENEGGAQK